MYLLKLLCIVIAVGILATSTSIAKENQSSKVSFQNAAIVDNDSYINANKILMFVTNHGNFGRDLSGVFGYDYGTWYPYSGNLDDYTNHTTLGDYSPLYAAGIWIGGKVNNQVRVSISEYSSEFVPGPMENNTFMADQPEFRVFKLYADSLKFNPNQDYNDYLNYGVAQGAPTSIDDHGDLVPKMRGDQMLWSVFNDANSATHTNMGSAPLGIEVQQTVWAVNDATLDTIPNEALIVSVPSSSQKIFTEIIIENGNFLTGDAYEITTATNQIDGNGTWSLFNVTTNQLLVDNQEINMENTYSQVIDGFKIKFIFDSDRIYRFEVVANANGVIDPPISGALASQGFPTPNSTDPDITQQVGDGVWAFHTGDNGGTSGGGTRNDYASFLSRTFREDSARWNMFGQYDWEMRFTGSNDNPGINGGYALSAFTTGRAFWVPFELWRTGRNTPDDSSDDLRLIPWIIGDDGDSLYYLSNYGSDALGNCGVWGCEHSASDGDDDPYTDWVYWAIPVDSAGNLATHGDDGYKIFEDSAIVNPEMSTWGYNEVRVLDRTVLINIDAGIQPPFNQETPEQGTIFRVRSKQSLGVDTNTFVTNAPQIVEDSKNAQSIYMLYKLTNKGANNIDSCFVSLWSDPDLGSAGDDLVGCDTTLNLWYCYNSTNSDVQYGAAPPAIGFKLIYGPMVPSQSIGDSAYLGENYLPNYKNLPMTAFSHYLNGTDPENPVTSYNYMKGLTKLGFPYYYNGNELKYTLSGDPVTSYGDIDAIGSDRRMMATSGPFQFNSYSVQYLLLKMSVGKGTNNLTSITKLKEILQTPYQLSIDNNCCIGYRGNIDGGFDDGSMRASVDISDLVYLVAYMFQGGSAPICEAESNLDGEGEIDIGDLVALVGFMFHSGPPPALCP